MNFLFERFEELASSEAIIWKGSSYSYSWILDQIEFWRGRLSQEAIFSGDIVGIQGNFTPNGVALLFALIDLGCILAPLTQSVGLKRSELLEIAGVEKLIELDSEDQPHVVSLKAPCIHSLCQDLKDKKHPGLILFSSGSVGTPKAVLHDFLLFLDKFRVQRKAARTISFLLYDHIGGINTLFHTMSSGGCLVSVEERAPDFVLETIEKNRVELLPTTPTFLKLMLISESHKRYDLSSLVLITYGTEPMPESTLRRLNEIFPRIRFSQTYGLSEIGILSAHSKSSESLWVKVGGEGFETRIANGLLEIKAKSAMLGYLNAPSPFTEDGWFKTGDLVELDGEYLKILGRESELINVGGLKVYPAEVESVILEMESVASVEVFGLKNAITGNIVCANVAVKGSPDRDTFALQVKSHCRKSLEPFKVPIKVFLVEGNEYSPRLKKMRSKMQSKNLEEGSRPSEKEVEK